MVVVKRLRVLVFLLAVGVCVTSAAADLLLFRGEFIYIIPREMSDEMTRFAGRSDWKQFPEHTRYLDVDNDGESEFVAIAFGASTGHAAQLRYRLRKDGDGTSKLGRWYWAVVTAPDGTREFEEFNP